MPKTVLVVDDDPIQRRILEETIKRFGYAVTAAETGGNAIAALKADASGDISLVLLDLAMSRIGGMAVLSALRSLPRKYPAIVQIAEGNIEAAMAAMGAGAVDFVVKPVSPERLEVSIKNALRIDALEGEISRMKASTRGEIGVADLIAGSEAMARVVDLGRRAAQSLIPVLIEGESGVGKALIGHAIHGGSARAGKPFVTVNCSVIPESEIERHLFGQVAGTPGKMLEADQGTLFLEEIGELPLKAQATLLRALQLGEIETLGATHPVKVDVRLIAATNQNLIDLVREGRLREDLYYRLNVFPIWVPPLRDRLDDVAEFVRLFIARFAAEEGKRVDGIEPNALAMLRRYSWPGNIRQLENAVFRAVALTEGLMLGVNEFPQIAAHVEGYRVTVPAAPAPKTLAPRIAGPVMLGGSSTAPATIHISTNGRDAVGIPALSEEGDIRSLEAVEADMIRLAFGRYRGRMTEIAKRLGIGRSTLYRKMREIGLEARAN
ncbi:MAG TPA: sigma-54 dependent transcriptional regulator [Methyloceanibacter sp.]|nr:sigma-54 dependent transcriptional regulator [Methyloceanibacter sp.]